MLTYMYIYVRTLSHFDHDDFDLVGTKFNMPANYLSSHWLSVSRLYILSVNFMSLCWTSRGRATNNLRHVLYMGVSYSRYRAHGTLNSTQSIKIHAIISRDKELIYIYLQYDCCLYSTNLFVTDVICLQ